MSIGQPQAKIHVLLLFPNIYIKIVILLIFLILRFFINKGKLLDKLECLEIKKSLCANENIVNDITFQYGSPLLDLCC